MLVRANGELASKLLAIDDDCGFSSGAWHDRLRVGVVGHGRKFPNVAALHCSRSLFLRVAVGFCRAISKMFPKL
jgi:hypothetical protein